MSPKAPQYDVIIAGGGPAGSTAGYLLAKAGLKVVILEKSKFPRFHIGESILPVNLPLIREVGLEPALKKLPQVPKYGAEFVMGHSERTSRRFLFSEGLLPGSPTFNIERAVFDEMLLNEARAIGAEVRENTTVKSIVRLNDGDACVALEDGSEVTGRILLDCSGHSTLVARHLGTRRPMKDPELQKVAYFNHFEGVQRLEGIDEGHPTIVMAREGWFWIIPLNQTRTSVGFVTRPSFVKELNVPPNRLFAWAVARCPVVRERMRNATGEDTNMVLSDFSYNCAPYAGPGHMMIGDAGCFLDPIFSTGVTLAMRGAVEAAQRTINILKHNASPRSEGAAYTAFVKGSTGVFWGLIRTYYNHSFRELFLNGTGPHKVHNAIISVLAGHVFPKPPFSLRWRLRMFYLYVALQRHVALVPRQPNFSLVETAPAPLNFSRSAEPESLGVGAA